MVGLCCTSPADAAAALAACCGNQLALVRDAVAQQQLDINAFIDFKSNSEKSSAKRTLCHIAAFHGCVEVLQYLLSQGADADARSPSDGQTPLHSACEGTSPRCSEVIEVLLAAGANKEATDLEGRLPVDLLLRSVNPSPAAPHPCGEHVPKQDESGASELSKHEYCTDEARMYMFKVAHCPNMEPHDWTDCPFAHPGEKARRRDPKEYLYTGVACPDFRKGVCKRGDACPFAHGVFECWLHPSRYRTQLCKDAPSCDRRVCFFAHQLHELRTAAPADAELLQACLAMSSNSGEMGMGCLVAEMSEAAAGDAGQDAKEAAAAAGAAAAVQGDALSDTSGGAAGGCGSSSAPSSSCSPEGSPTAASACASSTSTLGNSKSGRSLTAAKERALAAVTGTAPYKPSPKLAALLAFGGTGSELLASLSSAVSKSSGGSSAGGSDMMEKSPVGGRKPRNGDKAGSHDGMDPMGGQRGGRGKVLVSQHPGGLHRLPGGHHQGNPYSHHQIRGGGHGGLMQRHALQQQHQQQQRLMQYYTTATAAANAAATVAHYQQQIQQQQAMLAALQQQQQQQQLLLSAAAAGVSPFAAAAAAVSGGTGAWGQNPALSDMLQAQAVAQALQQQQAAAGEAAFGGFNSHLMPPSLMGMQGNPNLGLQFPTSPTAGGGNRGSRSNSLMPPGSLGPLAGLAGLPDMSACGGASAPLNLGAQASDDWLLSPNGTSPFPQHIRWGAWGWRRSACQGVAFTPLPGWLAACA